MVCGLEEQGVMVTATQAKDKWNALKKRYRDVKQHNARNGVEVKFFKYKEEFDYLYGHRASTVAKMTLDSMTTSDLLDFLLLLHLPQKNDLVAHVI